MDRQVQGRPLGRSSISHESSCPDSGHTGLQVLTQLLLLTCDPSMAAAARMQQCLAVFFKAYAAQSAQAHRHLSAAVFPAARRALSIGPSPAKSAAPHLLKFVSTLLQAWSWPGVWTLCFTRLYMTFQRGLGHAQLSKEESVLAPLIARYIVRGGKCRVSKD